MALVAELDEHNVVAVAQQLQQLLDMMADKGRNVRGERREERG